jgi:NTE family protein
MSNVVNLRTGKERRDARVKRRPRRSDKTALVLGGGGFTGGVYEIGALRALDLLTVNKSINDFDIYVGTSAGSLIASFAANGISPEQMMRVVNDQVPTPFRDIDYGSLMRPNLREFVVKGARLPWDLVRVLREVPRSVLKLSPMELVIAAADLLPSGIYTGAGIESYVRDVLSGEGRTDDFRSLANELYIAATDLDTCERIVLGAEGWDDVPISSAVRASAALPMVYQPHVVKDRELIDGGIVSTTNLDIAIEAGAKFVLVVNPLVPYVNDFQSEMPGWFGGGRPQRVSDLGFTKIGYQTFKLLAYQRLHEMARTWEQRYPGVDIVLIEPEPDDRLMFETDILDYSSRIEIARHGFQSVTVSLAGDYERLHEVCARHGIEISATRVNKVVQHFGVERSKTRAWRRILEQTTSALLRQSASSD